MRTRTYDVKTVTNLKKKKTVQWHIIIQVLKANHTKQSVKTARGKTCISESSREGREVLPHPRMPLHLSFILTLPLQRVKKWGSSWEMGDSSQIPWEGKVHLIKCSNCQASWGRATLTAEGATRQKPAHQNSPGVWGALHTYRGNLVSKNNCFTDWCNLGQSGS